MEIDKLKSKIEEIIKLYASKRRDVESVKESFDELKQSFKSTVKEMIESGFKDFDPDKFEPFALELFESYTEYGYEVPNPDGTSFTVKTIKELKDSNVDYRGFKFSINMKEAEKAIEPFIYHKQWFKGKHEESIRREDFIISTGQFDLYMNEDIMKDGFKESFAYFKKTRLRISKIKESIQYLPPESSGLNITAMPSWIKKLDEGKILIKESSELEKEFTFSGGALKGNYLIKRENTNSDFWSIFRKA